LKKSAILILSLCGFFIVACGVAKPQTAQPNVNDIVARYVSALGGRAAISKVTTRISKGTFELEGLDTKGTAESYAKAPNKYMTIITIPGYGEVRTCFDGLVGWTKRPETGLVAMMGQDLSSQRRRAEIYQAIKLNELYPQLSLKGQQDVEGWPAYVVEGEPGDGTLRRMYFDVSSGLLTRNDEEQDSAEGRERTEFYLSDYREVEGVKVPFTIRQIQGKSILTVRLTDVLVNQPIEDSVFSMPAK
jgi:zinc protease